MWPAPAIWRQTGSMLGTRTDHPAGPIAPEGPNKGGPAKPLLPVRRSRPGQALASQRAGGPRIKLIGFLTKNSCRRSLPILLIEGFGEHHVVSQLGDSAGGRRDPAATLAALARCGEEDDRARDLAWGCARLRRDGAGRATTWALRSLWGWLLDVSGLADYGIGQ